MSVRAFDGMDWSAWDTFNLTTLPINHAPIVTAPDFYIKPQSKHCGVFLVLGERHR
jgi:hypothetical protein